MLESGCGDFFFWPWGPKENVDKKGGLMRILKMFFVVVASVVVCGAYSSCGWFLNNGTTDMGSGGEGAELPSGEGPGGGGGEEPGAEPGPAPSKEVPAMVIKLASVGAEVTTRIVLGNILTSLGLQATPPATPSISVIKSAENPTFVELVEMGCHYPLSLTDALAAAHGVENSPLVAYEMVCDVLPEGRFTTHGYFELRPELIPFLPVYEDPLYGTVKPIFQGVIDYQVALNATGLSSVNYVLNVDAQNFLVGMEFLDIPASIMAPLKSPRMTKVAGVSTGAVSEMYIESCVSTGAINQDGTITVTPQHIVIVIDGETFECVTNSGVPVCEYKSACTPKSEVCDNGVDDDCDGLVDYPADPDCSSIVEICDNGIDDDGDGFVDCRDTNCAAHSGCQGVEICNNHKDDDGDGKADCWDDDCSALPACHENSYGVRSCIDEVTLEGLSGAPTVYAIDNDSDGVANCCDPDCVGDSHCVEICDNYGIDDDCDGFADCSDIDCQGFVNQAAYIDCTYPHEFCNNKDGEGNPIDDDKNGMIDCNDWSCSYSAGCQEVRRQECRYDTDLDGTPQCCQDGNDNDGNGMTDCSDPSCKPMTNPYPWCSEDMWHTVGTVPIDENGDGVPDYCVDGIDNDSDWSIDCADSDCREYPWCQEDMWHIAGTVPIDENANGVPDNCEDGQNNDSDMDTDCADGDCQKYARCNEAQHPGCGGDPAVCCTDGVNNDGDWYTDCQDSDCLETAYCNEAEYPDCVDAGTCCHDDSDNDGDGATDCLDYDCSASPYCNEALHPDCGGNPAVCCTDKEDNDGDGSIDCADQQCAAMPVCNEASGEGTCKDGIDNDASNDTYTRMDCDDDDCKWYVGCNEDCCNGLDDADGDGKADFADPQCDTAVCGNYPTYSYPPENFYNPTCNDGNTDCCADGIDNDGDGNIDCDDRGCADAGNCKCGNGACEYLEECALDCATEFGRCSDGVNNDENTTEDGIPLVDCDDSVCWSDYNCTPYGLERICNDGVDNDFDGAVDCNDSDCVASAFCRESNCTDGIDNDGDGDTDCADFDCDVIDVVNNMGSCSWQVPGDLTCLNESVVGNCNDGADNDNDGRVDCEDPDCNGVYPCSSNNYCDGACYSGEYNPYECSPEGKGNSGYCNDGVDNDLNGLTDCCDPGCCSSFSCSERDACQPGYVPPVCDDVVCGACESEASCPNDCYCGNGTCDAGETYVTCPVECAEPLGETNCSDWMDNDSDGKTDCMDQEDCCRDSYCLNSFYCKEQCYQCSDGMDNDSDGNADCADSDCLSCASCMCGNGTCDSGYGESAVTCPTDCYCGNGTCESGEVCASDCSNGEKSISPLWYNNCADGVDNDEDGSKDCADTECKTEWQCNESSNCGDCKDNDLDGSVDCNDTDCNGNPMCGTPVSGDWTCSWGETGSDCYGEICCDDVDNNGLYGTDCADMNYCSFQPICQ